MVALLVVLVFLLIKFQQYTTTIFGGVLLTIFALGWINSDDLLSNASNQGLATLVLLILISYALEKTSLLTHLTRLLFSESERTSLIRTIAFSGVSSALLNNTAVVAAMINAIQNDNRVNVSRVLLPMCFAATLGGTMTLIGTSTNLVVNSMWVKQGHDAIGFFDLTPIGLAIFAVGSVVLYFTSKMLPKLIIDKEPIDEYFVEAEVEIESTLVGKTVEEAKLRNLVDLFLVEIIRCNRIITPVSHYDEIQAGDKLIFSGDVKRIQVLSQFDGLKLFAEDNGLPTQTLTEVAIKQDSNLVGSTLKATGFRAKFDAAVVAVRRDSGKCSGKLGDVKLRAGDILILATGPDFSSRNNIRKNFFVLSGVKPQSMITGWREKLVIFGFVGMILASVVTGQPLFNLALYLFAALLITGCIDVNEIKQHFPISIWLIVVSALCLANAMSTVGLDTKISELAATGLSGLAPSWSLLGILLLTTLITELLTNNAAAALMFPIAYSIAVGIGIDPYPMILAVCFGASCSFISPFGYQTNLMVFNTGIYNIKDFAKVGALVTLVVTVICVMIIPIVYPF
jgi:di/tricarboxylate transporter